MRLPCVIVVLAAQAACGGGSSDPDACVPIDAPLATDAPSPPVEDPLCVGTPCGGDIRGTWMVTASCAYGTGTFLPDCSGSSISIFTFSARWRITINPDLTATVRIIDELATGSAYVPLSCFPDFTECDQVEAALAGNRLTSTCQDRGPVDACGITTPVEACACDVRADVENVDVSGSFTQTGTDTLLMNFAGETIPLEYCVENDQLWFSGMRFGTILYRYRFQRVL